MIQLHSRSLRTIPLALLLGRLGEFFGELLEEGFRMPLVPLPSNPLISQSYSPAQKLQLTSTIFIVPEELS